MSRVKPSDWIPECFAVLAVITLLAAGVNFLVDFWVTPDLVAVVHMDGGR